MREKIRGTGLIEVVVSAAIITLVVLGLMSAFSLHLQLGMDISKRLQANLLAEEGIELMKFFRDESWTNKIAPLSTSQTYYLLATSSEWMTTTTPQVYGGNIVRQITFQNVQRDSSGIIVASGGTLDSGTRKISVSVGWSSASGTSTKTISTYVMNLFNN